VGVVDRTTPNDLGDLGFLKAHFVDPRTRRKKDGIAKQSANKKDEVGWKNEPDEGES
jgi:hypothetical protein